PVSGGRYVKVRVRDEGPGIPPEHLPRIFDPYFTTKSDGSGLGLATSYIILKNHGGAISAQSEPGAGSVFDIYIPASEQGASDEEASSDELVRGAGKVLIMDDERAIRDLAQELLSMLGYEVAVAGDGDRCLGLYKAAMISSRPFDAVILDLTVPGGMGGIEAMKRLREIDPEIKAIVSSGYSDNPIMANYRDLGFSGVIPKPYSVHELSHVLASVID
ncbi:response regulator, partial [Thermodesulfobacteriota bacterium]